MTDTLLPIIIGGVAGLTLIIMYFVYNNSEVALRTEADTLMARSSRYTTRCGRS